MNVTSNRSKDSHNHLESYEVTCLCKVPVNGNTQCGITFLVNINTGSPISYVNRELIPFNVNVTKPLDNNFIFSGINGTKLDLLEIFEIDISVNDNIFSMCFYVVLESTMIMSAILGRVFVTEPGVNLLFKNGVVHFDYYESELNKTDSFCQILCVSYEHEFDNVNKILNVNPELNANVKEQLFELYQNSMVIKLKRNIHWKESRI